MANLRSGMLVSGKRHNYDGRYDWPEGAVDGIQENSPPVEYPNKLFTGTLIVTPIPPAGYTKYSVQTDNDGEVDLEPDTIKILDER